ncbi:MAG: hypothetical protein HY811_06375 [Planctomycetes bacterium]|nr:hypothetical protein [Planctomycetota bacterium]
MRNIVLLLVFFLIMAGFILNSELPAKDGDEKESSGEQSKNDDKKDEPKESPKDDAETKGGDKPAQDVLDRMTVSRKADLTTMARLEAKEILVLGADPKDPDQYSDKVQEVLTALKIPYTPLRKSEIEKYDFKDVAAILCNCFVKDLNSTDTNRIKEFLSKGGYLFTTDWCLDTVIRKVSPGYLKTMGIGKPTMGGGMGGGQEKEQVSVKPKEKMEKHIFLRDVFPEKAGDFKWVLDTGFKYFKLERPAEITVLIVGDEGMKKKYQQNEVVVCWTYGGGEYNPVFSGYEKGSSDYIKKRNKRGVIMHVISHFYMQALGFKDDKGNSSMYQLVANFLVDAKLAKNARETKK